MSFRENAIPGEKTPDHLIRGPDHPLVVFGNQKSIVQVGVKYGGVVHKSV
jgi:hypothetical protein